ncbi:terminase small subunit [Salmonella enterica subsp. enterica serovar Apapa]|uniref:Terminase small subunit n=1 Tax=Salmonella enterica subsp. enterica serovar Lattenkamp TaxID=2564671 RepID=A0A734CCK3_SALET|nr:terminase small subunit [Salmonella enterica]EAW1938812.1 terminase small subunit [Salmonella enterica subsp. enterica]EBH9141679.1 terminase small subunit [Salmonella enterica subsp. enterica serovar Cerro]EBZ6489932.1 terminase small subunit [Salmonella enterica subsp. enterica serovar Dugbe]EDH5507009.1 terminase small subunit [Salmonella enterica subsp. enterica serovar Apapa]EEJ2514030.1 terminase small subunit [Salmonella enterica subsp. enterica serovar California]EKQ9731118.1 termi
MPAEPKSHKRKSTQFEPLSVLKEAYCQEYIKIPENQTQAAINAGYSPNTAGKFASQNMRDERVQKRIAELMEERNRRSRISADYVLMRLKEIDELDLADIMNDDLSLKPLSSWPKAWRQFLSGVKVAELFEGKGDEKKIIGVLKSIKWPDKVKNLELIGKHVDVNAFKERLEVSGTVTIADRMAAARRRVKEQAGGEE